MVLRNFRTLPVSVQKGGLEARVVYAGCSARNGGRRAISKFGFL